jgi:hypothetical protein
MDKIRLETTTTREPPGERRERKERATRRGEEEKSRRDVAHFEKKSRYGMTHSGLKRM